MTNELRVIKRGGKYEDVSFDKILRRIKRVSAEAQPPLTCINYSQLAMKVIDQLYTDIPTHIIDELTAEQCASLCTKHLDYGILASRIIVSNNHKNTPPSFSQAMELLYNFKDIHGAVKPLLHEKFWQIVKTNKAVYDDMIDHDRDYLFDYFGFKTMERAYLMQAKKKIIERPQYMWLRVAIAIHGADFNAVKESYDLMSLKYMTHATPTLFNAGTPRPQLSSCYLIGMEDDSIDGIYNTLKDCAKISKWAGGIGLHIHNVRATGSHIQGTNGTSNGIVPMLRVFNMTARYVDQGGGKRNGSFAIYLEPWHGDIYDFLDLKKNHGDEEMRARDMFYALWIPDLFMEQVKCDGEWSLFCPHQCPGLSDCYGDAFNVLYYKYVAEGKALRTVKARDIWYKILDSQMETGTPYLLYKDAANKKSNQKNLGVIKSSNLCTEIMEYSDSEQTAVCNLASICLSRFVDQNSKLFDYALLHKVVKIVTGNLNRVIDISFYPTEKTRVSNRLHRPIGIGVQGLADVFALMDLPFQSAGAKDINKRIFETMYHAALERSNELAQERAAGMQRLQATPFSRRQLDIDPEIGLLVEKLDPLSEELRNLTGKQAGAYSSFKTSPAAEGVLQFDMWNVDPTKSSLYDWPSLKTRIREYGLRNSLLLAPMPTASTSQIMGNNECFEPFTSNIYSRRTVAGDYIVANKYLMAELIALGLWSDALKDNIIQNKGSIQQIDCIPAHIKEKYKIVWEISMKSVIDMAADRGAFICQSQSLNLWMEDPDYKALTSMHFYGWQAGLKTGMYYLRRKPKHQPQQFTIVPDRHDRHDGKKTISSFLPVDVEEPVCDTCSS